jgi:hypothetical protein
LNDVVGGSFPCLEEQSMKPMLKFLVLVVLLNLARYLLGWLPEGWWVLPGMFGVMEKFPESFNVNFSSQDFAVSLFYNFMLWLSAAWIFHVAHANVRGNFVVRSLKVYGIIWLFFISLSAVYMNHFVDRVKPFYLYSMLDAIVLFPIIALANGLLYPRLFRLDFSRN